MHCTVYCAVYCKMCTIVSTTLGTVLFCYCTLYCTSLCMVLHCVLYCVLYFIVYRTALRTVLCTALHCVLYCTAYCTTLCTVLYCILYCALYCTMYCVVYCSVYCTVRVGTARRLMARNGRIRPGQDFQLFTKSELHIMRSVVDGLRLIHRGQDYVKDALSHVITMESYSPYQYIVKRPHEAQLSCYYILHGGVQVGVTGLYR